MNDGLDDIALFIYWKLPRPQLAAALQAVRAFQAAQRAAHPALQASLYRRQSDDATRVTLMETYSHPGGLPIDLALTLEQARPLASWCQGGRHVERFVPDADSG